eukprot:CAMPEP_0194500030 /NCGR_PEP_ID=MMETSP0253-20130528/16138_1 /TAXON_ID=2966 /ORGANISM="Noctiluca scintillans" /LENGTH=161 /DNA_ID=CAMNT_0039341841 /DNA_START=341 /DNA_END=826 /DNA_ORIENTATION=-
MSLHRNSELPRKVCLHCRAPQHQAVRQCGVAAHPHFRERWVVGQIQHGLDGGVEAVRLEGEERDVDHHALDGRNEEEQRRDSHEHNRSVLTPAVGVAKAVKVEVLTHVCHHSEEQGKGEDVGTHHGLLAHDHSKGRSEEGWPASVCQDHGQRDQRTGDGSH